MNDIMKEKRGFTLVELLAVIVVLAIIMLIAVQAVLPLMQQSRKNAFTIEANGAIDAAMTYFVSKAISGEVVGTGICYKLDTLEKEGMYTTKKAGYEGFINIVPSSASANVYLYKVTMTNGQYYVENAGVKDDKNVSVTIDDVTEGKKAITYPEGCK